LDRDDYLRLCSDLVAEEEALDAIVADLSLPAWSIATPAEGWDVRDQIGHLATSEDLATLAATDPSAFGAELERRLAEQGEPEPSHIRKIRSTAPDILMEWWRSSRAGTVAALQVHDPRDRLPWAVRDMSAMSFTTARLMETWAHGQDVVDGLAVARAPTDRLFHIAVLGVMTRPFSYVNRGLHPPAFDVRVELVGPGGQKWAWGEAKARDRVTGPALDFCLVVTQRRAIEDTVLVATGAGATEWMATAQAFAGPPSARILRRG
jgi:uncharacterized protein (TIGR03084 family)